MGGWMDGWMGGWVGGSYHVSCGEVQRTSLMNSSHV